MATMVARQSNAHRKYIGGKFFGAMKSFYLGRKNHSNFLKLPV